MKIYTFLIPFVVGVILTVFCYQAYTIYTLSATVSSDHATITSVVSFLNTQIQNSQNSGAPSSGQQQAVPQPAAAKQAATQPMAAKK